MDPNPFAALPRTDHLLEQAPALVTTHGYGDAKGALGLALDRARDAMGEGQLAGDAQALSDWVIRCAAEHLDRTRRAGPRAVVNAAGVVVHTNLGRAPLSDDAVRAVVAAAGYCDLEYDLAEGRRGSRGAHVDGLLAAAAGAEDAVVVNNCAAALVLVLSVLAGGRQVPVSRGHLVEIGGSFRLPDIMAASGATLLEVGTTNRTRARDYRLGDDVGVLLTVHPSNFTQDGFVSQPTLSEVAAVAADRGVPLVHDAGSGLLRRPVHGPLTGELGLADALAAGADLVLASGDKLLGGPQAGLVVGRRDLVQRLRSAPLMRALRLDKLRLAAMNATLLEHLRGEGPPTARLLGDMPDLDGRAAALAAALDGQVVQGTTMIGGGSAPGVGVTSPVVALDDPDPSGLARALRTHAPPVIVRVGGDRVLIDLRTVPDALDDVVADAVRSARDRLRSG